MALSRKTNKNKKSMEIYGNTGSTTSRTYFLGIETETRHNNDWEKDCSLDNFGMNDMKNDYVAAI